MLLTWDRKEKHGAASMILAGLAGWMGLAISAPATTRPDDDAKTSVPSTHRTLSLSSGQCETLTLGDLKAGETYRLLVTIESGRIASEDRLNVELIGSGPDRIRKELHAGDP